MSFLHDLTAKGITRTGGIEVSLGLPLSSHMDRVILQRLNLPAAQASLSKPLAHSSPVSLPSTTAVRHFSPKEVVGHVLTMGLSPTSLTVLRVSWASDRAAENTAQQTAEQQAQTDAGRERLKAQAREKARKIKEQQAALEKVATESQGSWALLQHWLNGKPVWPWEWDQYRQETARLRLALESKRIKAQALAMQIEQQHFELLLKK